MSLRRLRAVSLFIVLAAAGLWTSCGGGGGGGGNAPNSGPAITSVTISPVSVTLAPGGQQQFTATVAGTGSFTTSVSWSASGGSIIPTTGLFQAPSSGGPFTITATSVQDTSKFGTATVALNMPAKPVISSFAANPATITPGQNTTLSWSVTGASSLSIDHGVGTVTGTNKGVSPTQTTTYTLTAANAAGISTAQTQVVVSGGGGNTVLGFQNCDPTQTVLWAAYQDGNSPWVRVQPTGNVYTFTVTAASGRYGFAYVAQSYGSTKVYVYQGVASEPSWFKSTCDSTVPVNGTLTGLNGSYLAHVSIGGYFATAQAYNGFSFQNAQVVPGTVEYIGGRYNVSGLPQPPDLVFVRRNVSITAPGPVNLTNVDMNSEAMATSISQFTVKGSTPSEAVIAGVTFSTPTANLPLGEVKNPNPTGGTDLVWNYARVPDPVFQSGDSYVYYAQAFNSLGQILVSSRMINYHSSASGVQIINLPLPLNSASATVTASTPYVRIQANWPNNPDYPDFYILCDQASILRWYVSLPSSWLIGGSSYTFPDFSNVSGWNNAWGMATGSAITYSLLGSRTTAFKDVSTASKGGQLTP